MNRLLICALAAIGLASCSSPKYTYNFDHYDYAAGKRKKAETPVVEVAPTEAPTPVQSDDQSVLTADASDAPVVIKQSGVNAKSESSSLKSYKEMNRTEKKEFRKELKNEFKKYVQSVKKGERIDAAGQNRNGALDPDVKMAIIFGAVGIVLLILGGVSEVFTILGAIALLVGVYFLIKWLIRQ
jgi:hypothetical protein